MKQALVGLFLSQFLFPVLVFGQDSLRVITLKEIPVNSSKILQRVGLYDSYETNKAAEINGFTQLQIFKGHLSDEVWHTENSSCVSLQLNEKSNETFIDLSWNKDQEECDWVGIGFGWDFWSSKDMAQIIQEASLEIEIRSKGKEMTNLPWAFGFEDYAGSQAWTGYSSKYVPSGIISSNWTKVQIPLAFFPFEENDCDPSNIKQLIIQLFAQDAVEIKSIQIVPFRGKLKEEIVSIPLPASQLQLDGTISDWKVPFQNVGTKGSFAVQHSKDTLYLAFRVQDDSPRLNVHREKDLWNGDAIEIAFSTNLNANAKRNLFLLSDYHIGLNCSENPYLWSFSDNEMFSNARFAIANDAQGYCVEIAIPLRDFIKQELSSGQTLGFEVAIDYGDASNKRTHQMRWNSSGTEGFHINPSLWGRLILQ